MRTDEVGVNRSLRTGNGEPLRDGKANLEQHALARDDLQTHQQPSGVEEFLSDYRLPPLGLKSDLKFLSKLVMPLGFGLEFGRTNHQFVHQLIQSTNIRHLGCGSTVRGFGCLMLGDGVRFLSQKTYESGQLPKRNCRNAVFCFAFCFFYLNS
ncbi:hypothetical protein C5167_031560 [Papaver somniferum]|uniref:Uncharacterized protein n=1 Tax=Papaver somniferum TaxID=3469 RepID=A0A4Y7K4M0_PAPSO|nr:hypothetical protein C5167_031560 [Papaver somniferum]